MTRFTPQTIHRREDGPKLRSVATKWRGEYRGVAFEVSVHAHTQADGEVSNLSAKYGARTWTWCYYLRVHEEQLPEELIPQFATEMTGVVGEKQWRKYSPFMESLHWHCGLTYYEIEGGLDGQSRVFVGGCDFNHYWDEGNDYNLNDVVAEVARTVNDLRERIPTLRWRCPIIGGYHALEDGEIGEDGTFVSRKGIEWRQKQWPQDDEGSVTK